MVKLGGGGGGGGGGEREFRLEERKPPICHRKSTSVSDIVLRSELTCWVYIHVHHIDNDHHADDNGA